MSYVKVLGICNSENTRILINERKEENGQSPGMNPSSREPLHDPKEIPEVLVALFMREKSWNL